MDAEAYSGGNHNPAGIGVVALIREDFRAHRSDWFSPGWRVLVVHRFGNWRMGVRQRALRVPLSVLYRTMHRRVRNKYGIEIDFTTRVGRRVMIHHQSGIVVSGYSEIDDDCLIRQNVTIGIRDVSGAVGAPRLGKRVDIGAGAVLLGDISIGDGAVVGANAVVLTDVPPGALAVGVPARIVARAVD
jgi:serine O-acetyltransferase